MGKKFREVVKFGGRAMTYGSLSAVFGAASAYILPAAALANPILGAIIGGACVIAGTVTAGAITETCTGPHIDRFIDGCADGAQEFQTKMKEAKEDIKTGEEFEKIMDGYPFKSSEGECKGREYLSGKGYSEADQDKVVAAYNKEREKKENKKNKKGSRG